MSKLASRTLVIALTCMAPYGALALDSQSLPSDTRMKVLMYNESDVYTVTVKYGYQTNVVFALHGSVSDAAYLLARGCRRVCRDLHARRAFVFDRIVR